MKGSTALTDQELAAYADEHLTYELNMLTWTAAFMIGLLRLASKEPLVVNVGNAILESFAIHARNLVDFLYKRDTGKDQPSDIVVQDYVDPAALVGVLPATTYALSDVNFKSNKQVAHLTVERIAFEKRGKPWAFGRIAYDITRAFKDIAHLFPASKTSDQFRELVKRPAGLLLSISAMELSPTAASMPVGLTLEIDVNPAKPPPS